MDLTVTIESSHGSEALRRTHTLHRGLTWLISRTAVAPGALAGLVIGVLFEVLPLVTRQAVPLLSIIATRFSDVLRVLQLLTACLRVGAQRQFPSLWGDRTFGRGHAVRSLGAVPAGPAR